ncbi:ABC transporter permease [bacterium]|nr:ABC transporter permease [bacterium]
MISYWKRHRDQLGQAIDDFFGSLSHSVIQFFVDCGQSVIFFYDSVKLVFARPFRVDEIIRHMEFIGNKSILIILLTGLFTGLALSFQIYLGFKLVNATNLVGPTVGLGITRELGPVLTGLIVAARAGGAMAARLGTMRVSEQIDAIQVMGINPKQYLVAPRIVAALISMPLLCAIFDFIAMMGAKFICIDFLGLDEAVFWDKIQLWLDPADINQGLIKAAVFGMAFTAICTNKGYNAKGGAKGVGEATNQGVVNSMVMIIVLNFFLTNIIRFFYALMGWS